MPLRTALAAVAGQQQRSRENAWKALPRLTLCHDDFSPDCQDDDIDIDVPLNIPSLEWGSSSDTPSYVKFVFEDFGDDDLFDLKTVTEDDDGTPTIEIPPVNPFSQPPQRRPFDYRPFSDPSFPYNFSPYSDELLVEGNRLFEDNNEEQLHGSGSETVTLAGVSIADSETDVFPTSLDSPIALDLPVEVDPKFTAQYKWEEIDWEVLQ